MSSAPNRGQFVWHELMTTDTAGAGAFYPRIAGWTTQPWELDSSYTLWVGEAGPMGGVMSLPQGAPASSHWMPYIGTPDIAATVEAARGLGATVCKDITRIPNGGSYAVLQDPQGAVFAVHSAGDAQEGAGRAATDFSWHELSTSDFEAALRFYSKLFGWKRGEKHDMGELGYYQLFSQGGANIGGIFNMPPGITTPHWLSYVRVSDVDAAAEAAKVGGGRVINGPMEVPGGDWIAQILDPQGAAFAVHEVKSAAQPPKKATARPTALQAKPAKASAARPAAAAKKAKPKPKPKKAAVKAKPSRKRATKLKRAAAKKASPARRRPAAKKKKVVAKSARRAADRKTAKKPARRLVRAKRRR